MPEIGIRIVGGGPLDWVMVPAQLVDWNIYGLLDCLQPLDCELEFEPGDYVTTMPLPDRDGNDVLVALNLQHK